MLRCLLAGLAFLGCLSAASATIVDIPFSTVYAGKSAVIVDVLLNGKGPYPFLLDTGAGVNVLTPSLVKELDLPSVGQMEMNSGGVKEVNGSLVAVKSAKLGPLELPNMMYASLALPSSMPFRGVLGVAFFEHFKVGIDFDRKTVHLDDAPKFKYPGAGQTMHLVFVPNDQRPRIFAGVEGHPGLYLLDTGNMGSIILNAKFVEKYSMTTDRKVLESSGDATVTGNRTSRTARLKTLKIGQFELQNQAADLLQLESDAEPDLAGNIGIDIIRRFNVVIDFRNHLIFVGKNKSFQDPSPGNENGMIMDLVNPGTHILGVIPGGPAAEAGILAGDSIAAVDGVPASKLDFLALRDYFLAPEGTDVEVTIERDHQLHTVHMKLRNLI
jgi:predicted aspartyl protease